MKFDLHVHTSISPCSCLSVPEILEEAPRRHLAGVCITDHDTMEIRRHLREGIQENGLCVIFGMEYTTSQGDFLLFGPFEELRTGLAAPELLRHVHDVGGAAIAAHPFRRNRSAEEQLIVQGLCSLVEAINGRNAAHENEQVGQWRRRYALHATGGSDAHTLEELGRVTTRFSRPITSRADFIDALKKSSFQAEHNTFLPRPPFSVQAS